MYIKKELPDFFQEVLSKKLINFALRLILQVCLKILHYPL